MRFSYFSQIVISFFISFILLILIYTLFAFYFIHSHFMIQTENEINSIGRVIVSETESVQDLVFAESLLEIQNAYLQLYNENNELVYPAARESQPVLEDPEKTLSVIKLQEPQTLIDTSDELLPELNDYVLMHFPIQASGALGTGSGTLLITSSKSNIANERRTVLDTLIRIALIAFAIAALLGIGFAHAHVRRINRLRKATRQVSTGDFTVQISHGERDEIDDLSKDFNKMVEALAYSYDKIEQQEQRRKEMLANVSHEMRTPLTTINGLLEGLEKDVLKGENRQKSIKLMQKETSRLIRMIHENLDYENIRNRSVSIERFNFSINEVAVSVAEQLKSQAREFGNEIVVSIPEAVTVYADYDRFTQIIVNIVRNAIQFTTDGTIIISAETLDEHTAIYIEDNGIGMRPEEMDKMWDRYYKADVSRTNKKYSESGIGLAVVQELLEMHEATVDVESTYGEGTKFSLFFPKKSTR